MAETQHETLDVPVIEPLRRTPSHLQLFLFSAATANPHRIHYDQSYARSEGYPDVIVQAHLHAAFLYEALMRA
jgi:hydroxyacyl-ACP dehydratase HTD2-like protein with hotdog domain